MVKNGEKWEIQDAVMRCYPQITMATLNDEHYGKYQLLSYYCGTRRSKEVKKDSYIKVHLDFFQENALMGVNSIIEREW